MEKKNSLTFHKLNWLEKLSIVLSLWFLLYPKPYEILLGVLLLIPVVGLLINGISKPSIATLAEVSDRSVTGYDVSDFIDFPAMVILVRVLLDYEVDNFTGLIFPSLIAFVIIIIFIFMTHKAIKKSLKNRYWIYSSIIFCILMYSFAAVYAINCTYDYSNPITYETDALNKRIHSGRRGRKTFYIEVSPWGHHYDKEEIRVSRKQYEQIDIGDKVNIEYKKGLLGIPWYNLYQKD
ncbi:MAG: hypothetical protein Q4C98_04705 [Capnocytophaga sp.]|nr:hypothetical protein [Capnocytophaga sp.]